jgi:hypothetical protein
MSKWARFYATVTNGRGNTTGVGGRSSVNCAHVRSADAGVRVTTGQAADGANMLTLHMTRGSNGETGFRQDTLLGTIRETPNGPAWEPAARAARPRKRRLVNGPDPYDPTTDDGTVAHDGLDMPSYGD